jgi:hypothetical protein
LAAVRLPTKPGGSQLGCGQAGDKRGLQRAWPIHLFGSCIVFTREGVFLSEEIGLYSLSRAVKILANRLIEDTQKIESDLSDAVALMKVTRLTTERQLVGLLKEWNIW